MRPSVANRNVAIFLAIAAMTLWANVGITQTEWVKYPDNPVLDLGAPGTWDDHNVFGPTVLFDGTEYKMWYAGDDGSHARIGYATSADGIVWTKYDDPSTPDPPFAESDPVLDIGKSEKWDDYDVFAPNVSFDRTENEEIFPVGSLHSGFENGMLWG